ncbi:transposable element Tcb1 transposase [Trichonephila clavipes]|nr:transposable element Tcb1 transposase [Trichonephila clavipes]
MGHFTSPESRIGIVCKITSVCTNSSTTFSASWTLSLETKAAANSKWHCDECSCIRHRRTDSSPDVMVWGANGYTSRSPLIRIDSTLNNARYISGVLRPVALPFIRTLRNPTFLKNNALPVLYGLSLILLPWPASSPDLSPMENVWSMVAKQLARHHMTLR